jgi:2-polyprenyl-6-methoxyphenol hydroxylase-like FAD-dependent oxidoreductase
VVTCPEEPDPAVARDLGRLAEKCRFEKVPSAILRATTLVRRPALSHMLPPVPVWHDDRIVLVGDAAHPVGSGRGASMAIEDAVVPAGSLEGAGTVAGALAAYDRTRRPRLVRMAKADGGNRVAKTAGPVGRALSDLMVFRHFYGKATAWLYAHRP